MHNSHWVFSRYILNGDVWARYRLKLVGVVTALLPANRIKADCPYCCVFARYWLLSGGCEVKVARALKDFAERH